MNSTKTQKEIAQICEEFLTIKHENPSSPDNMGMENLCSTFLILHNDVIPERDSCTFKVLMAGIGCAAVTVKQQMHDDELNNKIAEDFSSVTDEVALWNLCYGIMCLAKKYTESGEIFD